MSLFSGIKIISDFLGNSSDDKGIEKLSKDQLLKKASQLKSDNTNMQININHLSEESNLLKNSDINMQNSDFSNFLGLLYNNFLDLKKKSGAKEYEIDNFKNFLYKEKIFHGSLDEDNINYLNNSNKFNWEQNKEEYQLKQEILEKNLKTLLSNMFTMKANTKNYKNENKDNKIKEKKSSEGEKKKKNYIEKKKQNEEDNKDILEDLLLQK